MKFCEAMDQTILEFHLSAKDLASAAGLTQAQLSEFRRGKRELHTDGLERLIAALPLQARHYLFFNHLIAECDEQTIGTLLYAISLKMRGVVPAPDFERLTA
ncbi:MAG: helix-turn-helix domain-containing protein [Scytolyngbya sp. HA4215-MV1]|nr:helix-turn-helix domain-containing protein [Scytolyngbya sp. HA4215-MV1]